MSQASPLLILPFGIPQFHIVGTKDDAWRIATTASFARAARNLGDTVSVTNPDGANHFDVVNRCGPAWPVTARYVMLAAGLKPTAGDLMSPGAQFCPPSSPELGRALASFNGALCVAVGGSSLRRWRGDSYSPRRVDHRDRAGAVRSEERHRRGVFRLQAGAVRRWNLGTCRS